MPIAPRARRTTPIIPTMIAKGAKNGDIEPKTIAIMIAKTPPITSLIGLWPIIAFEVPGGGGGMTMTGATGLGAKANPQLLQNWAPGTNGVWHCVQTDNAGISRTRLSIKDNGSRVYLCCMRNQYSFSSRSNSGRES
jgi:hypothetical protein